MPVILSIILSVIYSILTIGVVVIKFIILTWRLCYETRNIKKISGIKKIGYIKNLWLIIAFSVFFVITSLLLLVFSFVRPEEKGLQITLLCVGALFLFY